MRQAHIAGVQMRYAIFDALRHDFGIDVRQVPVRDIQVESNKWVMLKRIT